MTNNSTDVAAVAETVGRTYGCRFRVEQIFETGAGQHVAVLSMRDGWHVISIDELATLIDRGFVVEVNTDG